MNIETLTLKMEASQNLICDIQKLLWEYRNSKRFSKVIKKIKTTVNTIRMEQLT